MQTSLQDSVEENAGLQRTLTEVVDRVRKIETGVNETGTIVSGKCHYNSYGLQKNFRM